MRKNNQGILKMTTTDFNLTKALASMSWGYIGGRLALWELQPKTVRHAGVRIQPKSQTHKRNIVKYYPIKNGRPC